MCRTILMTPIHMLFTKRIDLFLPRKSDKIHKDFLTISRLCEPKLPNVLVLYTTYPY